MKLKVIGSSFIKKELYLAAAHSPHDIDLIFFGEAAEREDIQQEIDRKTDADCIILALGEDISEGIRCEKTPIVVPRIHNFAHLMLGSRKRFYDVFCENEDSPCWIGCNGELSSNLHGYPCYVGGFVPKPQLPAKTREYIADPALLRRLLNGDWSGDDIFILKSGKRIIKDAVEILDSEAF